MKILHCISSINPKLGGVTQAVNIYSTHLERFNVISVIVTIDSPTATYAQVTNIVALGPASPSWRYSNLYKPWLETNISNYDIVILHGIWLYQHYALHSVIQKFLKTKKKCQNFWLCRMVCYSLIFKKVRKDF